MMLVMARETRALGCADEDAGAGAGEDTLPLRVARSGTKLPAAIAMLWYTEACRSQLEAKYRRLLKVFSGSCPRISILVMFWTRFARSTLST